MHKGSKSKLDEETIDEILEKSVYILQGSSSSIVNDKNDDKKTWIEFRLPPKWEQAQEKLIQNKANIVKFWCLLTVTPDLKLSYAYYLSKFK